MQEKCIACGGGRLAYEKGYWVRRGKAKLLVKKTKDVFGCYLPGRSVID